MSELKETAHVPTASKVEYLARLLVVNPEHINCTTTRIHKQHINCRTHKLHHHQQVVSIQVAMHQQQLPRTATDNNITLHADCTAIYHMVAMFITRRLRVSSV